MDDRQRRRIFQRVKTFSNDKFWEWMNWLHSQAYAKAVQHYTEAAEIVLPPRYQKALHDKATEIREQWDGMSTVTLDGTTGTEFDRVMGQVKEE
ncbi:hypothetical protein DUZ99_02145 [Xylanibacillus composti]|uniref:Uncharacterized protein n=1 Tax=Xylanibacillus composti TaxID=1572762 RepID=A0A8J4M1D9_9BACL|nr:hypothetical protein [Xylanibacillus composti]MDT9723796.1 hypothetical protein [Xylanibacillus composti]GIQ67431.1 hypothetical protein XYCOK13_02550 [Xylanibacillus composti]